jgi:hypothetical protein
LTYSLPAHFPAFFQTLALALVKVIRAKPVCAGSVVPSHGAFMNFNNISWPKALHGPPPRPDRPRGRERHTRSAIDGDPARCAAA